MLARTIKSFFWYWLPALAWAWLIFYLSSIPSLESGFEGSADWVFRKAAHIFVYAVLTWLMFRTLRHGYGAQTKTALLRAGMFALLYAFSDELHQHFVPGRHGRLRDVVVDAIGIFAAVMILRTPRSSQIPSGSSSQAR